MFLNNNMSLLIGHYMNVKIGDYGIDVLCVGFNTKTQEYIGIYLNKFNYSFTYDKIVRLKLSHEEAKRLDNEKKLLKEFNSF